MGIYDSLITTTRTKIDRLYSEIDKCKNDISELQGARTKADTISTKVDEVMNNIFRKIENKSVSIEGNFAAYYRDNVNRIAKENKLYDISGNTVSDKNRINSKIIDLEDRIRDLRNQISNLEGDLSYYRNNNVEEEAQVK